MIVIMVIVVMYHYFCSEKQDLGSPRMLEHGQLSYIVYSFYIFLLADQKTVMANEMSV